MDKTWYEHTVNLPFEYTSIPVPASYHEILSVFYGDYMTPVKAGSLHGDFWQLDPDTDYHHYLPEQKREFRRKRRNNLARRIRNIFKRIFVCNHKKDAN
jgi:hypothetical protein